MEQIKDLKEIQENILYSVEQLTAEGKGVTIDNANLKGEITVEIID